LQENAALRDEMARLREQADALKAVSWPAAMVLLVRG
jgi:hypothetical protein